MKWNIHIFLFFIIIMTGCSSGNSPRVSASDKIFPEASPGGPQPPDRNEPGLVIPGPGSGMTLSGTPGNAPAPSSGNSPTVSLVSVSGAVVSVWSRRPNSWVWGYTPRDSNTFGNLRNWFIQPGKTPGSVRFVNEETGTCLTPGFSFTDVGFIHRFCSYQTKDQDFLLVPTLNGNVLIRSVLVNKCIRARFLDRTPSSPYAFEILQADCPEPGKSTLELLWSVSEPLKPALATISKPEFRPAQSLPLNPDIPAHKVSDSTENQSPEEWSMI
ncbi:TPA: toxin [Salmonella enterica subsp. houtenae]|nr:toxin [Salmonella enterica subsp. houtenae]